MAIAIGRTLSVGRLWDAPLRASIFSDINLKSFSTLESSSNETTSNSKWFLWGHPRGALGHAIYTFKFPTKIFNDNKIEEQGNESKWTDYAFGVSHGIRLKQDGSLEVLGTPRSTGTPDKKWNKFSHPDFNLPVKAIACGAHHTLVLTENGEVWTWGLGGMSLSGWKNFQPEKVHIPTKGEVVQIACGYDHSLIRLANGHVLQWKQEEYENKIGHPFWTAKPVEGLNVNATHIVGGRLFSIALTADGACYSWGRGDKGQLGTKEFNITNRGEERPTKMKFPEKVVAIDVGDYHGVALMESNDIYSWGHGAVFHPIAETGDNESFLAKNRLPKSSANRVKQVGAAGSYSFYTNELGEMCVWGPHTKARIINRFFPLKNSFEKIDRVVPGPYSMAILATPKAKA